MAKFYFGYQIHHGAVEGVRFHEDHTPSHRLVIQKHEITPDEFKWTTWGILKQKFPYEQKSGEETT